MKKTNFRIQKHHITLFTKTIFWFSAGIVLGLFFTISFAYILFQKNYSDKIYPGISINNIHVGGKTPKQVTKYFDQKNAAIGETSFTFTLEGQQVATISAHTLHLGYNSNLLSQQAYAIGRSQDIFSNISLILQAYINDLYLPPSYHYDEEKLFTLLAPMIQQAYIAPVNALFSFQNGRVTAFQPSSNGKEIDKEVLTAIIAQRVPLLLSQHHPKTIVLPLPIRVVKPAVSTNDANGLGIEELIGTGTSLFQHSIPSRVYNVTLAAKRINGVLIKPNEVFSFDQALGDVSAYTGYQQAYVIQNGKTVLGDGGGVCQVSTTFFRALLNAGLPITERHAHAYRVAYYEEDSPPGIDATIFVPSVDLKFKNDTNNYILVQTVLDPDSLRLTFNLYGKKDGRNVLITKPIITHQTSAPAPLYQDDPTLPKGTIKQVDFSADGATVSFSRTVTKQNRVIIADTYVSDYKAWQAIFLRGTKE